MKAMGVDTVRVTVLWRNVAEFARPGLRDIKRLKGKSKSRARASGGASRPTIRGLSAPELGSLRQPRQGGDGPWHPRLLQRHGSGPDLGAAHAAKRLRRLLATYKPKAGAYKQFVTAVGRRFDGTYRDENGARDVLPRVSMWSLWNEPNRPVAVAQ